jgi:hypothetical protein
MTKMAGDWIPLVAATFAISESGARTERWRGSVPCSMTAAGVKPFIPAASKAALTSAKVLTPI